jgi:hypothetical protein
MIREQALAGYLLHERVDVGSEAPGPGDPREQERLLRGPGRTTVEIEESDYAPCDAKDALCAKRFADRLCGVCSQ